MSGYCEVDFSDTSDDVDQVEFFNEKRVMGRKAHTCIECGQPIAVGESHISRSYRFEGAFHSERVCDPCRETAAEFDFHICGGSLWFFMGKEWDNGANVQGCLNRLTTAHAKARMLSEWTKWNDKRMARAVPNKKPGVGVEG